MKIERMIEQLQKIAEKCPGADVKLHHPTGNVALFCLCTVASSDPTYSSSVFIEDESDIDVRNELYAQIEHAKEIRMKDVDLLNTLFDIGFNWKHLKDWLDEEDYKYWVEVGNVHGLIKNE